MDRTRPKNIAAEKTVLGSIFARNELFETAAEKLRPEDFYGEANRLVFQAMGLLRQAGKPIDAVTLMDALAAHVNEVGTSHIGDLAGTIANEDWTAHHAEIVRKLADRRRLADYGAELERQACDSPTEWSVDDDELYACAAYDLEQIVTGRFRQRQPLYHWREVRDGELWRIEHGEAQGIPTGIQIIDNVFGGFKEAEPAYLGARTSVGKTQLAINIGINAARGIEVPNPANGTVEKRSWPTAFFSIEMPLKGVALRPVGPLSKVDLFKARKVGVSDTDKFNIDAANHILNNIPLEILHWPIFRPRDLRAECKRLKREIGLKFFIVDYQGLMLPDAQGRGEARWEKLHTIVQQIKDIAGELELAGLVLSQLNRLTEGTQKPSASQLRDTGFSEETGSDVLLLWQSAPDVDNGAWQPLTLEIEKQRSGPHHIHVPLEFLPTAGQFRAGSHHEGCCPELKEQKKSKQPGYRNGTKPNGNGAWPGEHHD